MSSTAFIKRLKDLSGSQKWRAVTFGIRTDDNVKIYPTLLNKKVVPIAKVSKFQTRQYERVKSCLTREDELSRPCAVLRVIDRARPRSKVEPVLTIADRFLSSRLDLFYYL